MEPAFRYIHRKALGNQSKSPYVQQEINRHSRAHVVRQRTLQPQVYFELSMWLFSFIQAPVVLLVKVSGTLYRRVDRSLDGWFCQKSWLSIYFKHCFTQIPDWIETVCDFQFLRDQSGIESWIFTFLLWSIIKSLNSFSERSDCLSSSQGCDRERRLTWKIEDQIQRIWWRSLQVGQRDKTAEILMSTPDASPCHAKMNRTSTMRKWTSAAELLWNQSHGSEIRRGGRDR